VLPAETQRALLERAGGNPLYAEEFVRLLSDRASWERRSKCRTRSRRSSPPDSTP
jgi:predicted ATPase